jgi:hypothetical protein
MQRVPLALVPLVLLVVSAFSAPYVTSVRAVAGSPATLQMQPHLLYRHGSTAFYYTSADLLRPEAFGKPGEFIEAVVFDVWASGEGVSKPTESLTWFQRTWSAVAGGPELTSPDDVDVAEAFRATIGGPPRLARGTISLVSLPDNSTYRAKSGLRHLIALAARPPDPSPLTNGAPQQLDQALERAFAELRKSGVSSAGVPRMAVVSTLGEEQLPRSQSWQRILSMTDVKAQSTGMRTILFGGWGVDPESRAATDTSFGTAWEIRRQELDAESRAIAHEGWRIGALVAFAALLRWQLQRRAITWSRLLALAIIAPGFAVAVSRGAHWLGSSLEAVPTSLLFAAECVVALGAGAVIERIVRFDPKEEMSRAST